jgi:hypothetical protein
VTVVGPGGVLFDPDTHEYRFDDRQLPSVTQILDMAGLIDRRWDDEAIRRGRAVHELVKQLESHPDGADAPYTAPPPEFAEFYGYLDAYRDFLHAVKPGPCVLLEAPLGDLTLGYAGTPDQVRPICGTLAVLDLKTGAAEPWHALQTAAYKELAVVELMRREWARGCNTVEEPEIRRYALYLEPTGRWKLQCHNDLDDWPVFKAALTVASWRRSRGR